MLLECAPIRSVRHAQLVQVVREVMTRTVASSDGEPAVLPNGEHAAVCTNGAFFLQSLVGGEVFGYWHADNPTARLGEGKDGHDFLLVDGRYIVDMWACDYERALDDGVIDLADADGRSRALELYGNRCRWVRATSTE